MILQFMRGVALAGAAGSVVLAAVLVLNVVEGTSLLIFPLAGVAAIVFGLIPDGDRRVQVLGASLVGLSALAMRGMTGFGWVNASGVVGAGAAVLLLASGRRIGWRAPLALVAGLALAVTVLNLFPLVLDGGGLGHDESAYALKARHWIEGTPATGWNLHRGIAMSVYGFLVFEAGGDEGALRLLGLAAIAGLAAATWVLGSRMGGKRVGPLATIALLASPTLLRRSTEYLSDVPSSALLVASMAVLWRQFGERERPGYGLLWLLPFAWASFYLRYQSVLSFALIAIMVALLFHEKVRKHWRPVALTAGLGLLGLIPHFVFATSETGSPVGIILFTADVAGREYYGEGLVDYFLLMAWPLAAFVGPLAVVFLVWWLVAERRSVSSRTRNLFLMIPAAGQVLVLGVLSHGEARFIFFPLALTLIGGVIGIATLMPRWRPTTAKAVSAGLVVALVASFALSAAYVRRAVENRAAATVTIELAAERMASLSGDGSCAVMTSYFPQITFYSGCQTQQFRTHLDPGDALDLVDGEQRFMLLVEDGKRQPTGDDLAALLALTTGDPIRVEGERGAATIYLFAPG